MNLISRFATLDFATDHKKNEGCASPTDAARVTPRYLLPLPGSTFSSSSIPIQWCITIIITTTSQILNENSTSTKSTAKWVWSFPATYRMDINQNYWDWQFQLSMKVLNKIASKLFPAKKLLLIFHVPLPSPISHFASVNSIATHFKRHAQTRKQFHVSPLGTATCVKRKDFLFASRAIACPKLLFAAFKSSTKPSHETETETMEEVKL